MTDITVTPSGVYSFEDRSWVAADPGEWTRRSITLDVAAFTKATHYPDGYVKSGLALRRLGSGMYGPTDGTAADGFLWDTTFVDGKTRVGAPLWQFGFVRTARLPIALATAVTTALGSWFKFETI